MANIPNSSRYRTTGRRIAAQGTVAPEASSWAAHQTSGNVGGTRRGATGNNRPHSRFGSWLWIIILLALLVAFPVPTLSVLSLLAVATWFMAKR